MSNFCPKLSPNNFVIFIASNNCAIANSQYVNAHSDVQKEPKMTQNCQKCKFSKIFGKILHKTCTHMISSSPIHGFVTLFQTPSPIIARFYTLKVLICRKRCNFGPKTFKIDSKMSKFCPKLPPNNFVIFIASNSCAIANNHCVNAHSDVQKEPKMTKNCQKCNFRNFFKIFAKNVTRG